jgi:LacI family transcriptional regulator
MPTMDDVARHAGVSGATVSHVLNSTRPVSESTRLRVEQAIEATGYRHNSLARALAAGRTSTIGMCVPILTNPYIADLVNSIETAAGAAGYTLMIGDSRDEPDSEARAVNTFLERRVDGVIMAPGVASRSTTIPLILASGTPLVLIDRKVDDVPVDQIFTENIESARRATAHLLSHGYRDVAVLRGRPGIRSTDERYEGFCMALTAAGIDLDPRNSVIGNANAEDSTAALERLISGGHRPEAIVTLNNAMTIGAMRAFKNLGVRVPADIALVSFDDFEWADLFSPRLTAVAQNVGGMGKDAVELLMSRIAHPDRAPRILSMPTTLVVRDSCGPHPV